MYKYWVFWSTPDDKHRFHHLYYGNSAQDVANQCRVNHPDAFVFSVARIISSWD